MTKSIRLAAEEAETLSNVARQTSISESALMKKWVLEGIRGHKLDMAIRAYMERDVDLRGGAVMADIPFNRFLHEVQKRNIIVLEDDHFLDRLEELADVFNSELLRQAVDRIVTTA
ncbi:MAG: hypothetical protein GY796_20335 [Chloroflexi bacterium]|nr:hypothetical protein [Chloroflexota bacterium]